MVKGVSKQVIVVHSPDPKLFEQAIFILKEDAVGQGITDEALLKEANQVINSTKQHKRRTSGFLWACGGAMVTGAAWLLTTFL